MDVQNIKQRFEIIGNSPGLNRAIEVAVQVAPTDLSVLITGESGTGKEIFPQIIHQYSSRKHGKYIAVNCGAIPEGTIDSELFGHEKGAFTGANYRRIGKFEEANGGTLFLDEITEMDVSLQAKLLRALQEKEIVRVGNNKPVKTDCRIIVASNQNLQESVTSGKFRQDLYYRLYGFPVELPPLRERGNDIIILAKHFIKAFCNENNLSLKTITQPAIDKLLSYPFPGNIRELKSVIELAITVTDTDEITDKEIYLGKNVMMGDYIEKEITLREYNINIVKKYLEKYDNNIKLVADKLDIGVATIYRMLKEDSEN